MSAAGRVLLAQGVAIDCANRDGAVAQVNAIHNDAQL